MLNVIDLFCGCGGMSKGLVDSGLNVIAGIDIWDRAIESYNKHLIKSIDFVSEATFAPRMLLKLKYKIELNEDINLKIINVIDDMNYLA